ncbi:hypothetical protein HY57_19995 [Dyella japonica A8]|uniref:GtrA/DPMS transmembrane domain-containing protein n=2 Tax=Dyella japonica TaxID=231455 RepID=A0A075K575_9GAMM|nr:hypothetical protein HY57_19995 [Dyella japonica A8]
MQKRENVVPSFTPLIKQFAAFVFVSSISAVCSLIVRYVANLVMPYEVAVGLAQVAGVIIAFTLNRRFVFSGEQVLTYARIWRFTLVNVVSLAIAVTVSSLAFRIVLPNLGVSFHPDVLAQLVGLAACALPSFLGHKYFSFRAAGVR